MASVRGMKRSSTKRSHPRTINEIRKSAVDAWINTVTRRFQARERFRPGRQSEPKRKWIMARIVVSARGPHAFATAGSRNARAT